jgi:hypothetical protein
MKRSLAVLVLALSLAGTMAYVHSVYAARPGSTWQSTEEPEIRLGVRDKYGNLGSYTANFVVEGKKGDRYQLAKKVHGDSFANVEFPQDFDGYAPVGSYTWKCLVNGKVAVSGRFELTFFAVKIAPK